MGDFPYAEIVTAGTEVRALLTPTSRRIVVVKDYDPCDAWHNTHVLLSLAEAGADDVLHPLNGFTFSIRADRFEQEYEVVRN